MFTLVYTLTRRMTYNERRTKDGRRMQYEKRRRRKTKRKKVLLRPPKPFIFLSAWVVVSHTSVDKLFQLPNYPRDTAAGGLILSEGMSANDPQVGKDGYNSRLLTCVGTPYAYGGYSHAWKGPLEKLKTAMTKIQNDHWTTT